MHFRQYLLVLLPASLAQVLLPPLTGKYPVGHTHLPLTDRGRNDVWTGRARKLMITVFYPSADHPPPTTPALSPALASSFESVYMLPNGTLSSYRSRSALGAQPLKSSNIKHRILFSPGATLSRFLDLALVEDLASHGYVVVSIDHPFDAQLVEFPDSPAVPRLPEPPSGPELDEFVAKMYRQRVQDILFVERETAVLRGLYRPARGSRTVTFGHSMGGAASAGAIAAAPGRFAGGSNMDGEMYGAVGEKPFLLMGTPDHNSTGDATWRAFRRQARAWNRELAVRGFKHGTYTDLSPLAKLLKAREVVPGDVVDELVGTVDADRGLEIVRRYVRDFVCWVVGDGKGELVDRGSAEFPEVEFL